MLTWCKSVFNSRAMPPILAVSALMMSVSPSFADGTQPGLFDGLDGKLESLLDFGALATQILPLLTTAIQAAAGIGVIILAALVCWQFFKRFIQG